MFKALLKAMNEKQFENVVLPATHLLNTGKVPLLWDQPACPSPGAGVNVLFCGHFLHELFIVQKKAQIFDCS